MMNFSIACKFKKIIVLMVMFGMVSLYGCLTPKVVTYLSESEIYQLSKRCVAHWYIQRQLSPTLSREIITSIDIQSAEITKDEYDRVIIEVPVMVAIARESASAIRIIKCFVEDLSETENLQD